MGSVKERCSCGATFEADGWFTGTKAEAWWLRHYRLCPDRVRPGEWRTTMKPTPQTKKRMSR